jgi:hypothetical protein
MFKSAELAVIMFLLIVFSFMDGVHYRNGKHSKLCPELARQDKGLILTPQHCFDRGDVILAPGWENASQAIPSTPKQ